MSKAQIIWKSIGVCVTALLLVGAVISGFRMTPTDAPCVSMRYLIEDKSERMYLTESELNMLLYAEDVYPLGRKLNLVSLHRIERAIKAHPMVRTAECYLTPRNEVRVQITQRVPMLRVQTNTDTWLVDTDRRVMQARAAVKDTVLIVSGNVGTQMAVTQLADFAEWLQENKYWNARVHHLYVQSPFMLYLYLKDANGKMQNERLVLGAMNGYERKLKKMRTFMENAGEAIEGKNYREFDLRFKGQVIGRY